MPITIDQIRNATSKDYEYQAALMLLQKLIEDEQLAKDINKEHDLETMLSNMADGLHKGNIRYLLGRFSSDPLKQKVREFFSAEGDTIGATPSPVVIAAIGEAYLGCSDKNIHSGILGALYQKLTLNRGKDDKINVGSDPFYKVGLKLLQTKKPTLSISNQELVDAIGEPHAKIFFAASCQEDGKASNDELFAKWKSFTGERPEFAERFLSPASVVAVESKEDERKIDMSDDKDKKRDLPSPSTTFSQEDYKAAYENHQKTPEYQSVDELSWSDLFKKIEEESKEGKERGSMEYDFNSLQSLLPDLKIPLSGKIRLPIKLAEEVDQKLAIELQKTEFKKFRR